MKLYRFPDETECEWNHRQAMHNFKKAHRRMQWAIAISIIALVLSLIHDFFRGVEQ